MVSKELKERFILQKRLAVCEAAVSIQQNMRSLKNIGSERLNQCLNLLIEGNVKLPFIVKAGVVEMEAHGFMRMIGAEWRENSPDLMSGFLKVWIPVTADDDLKAFDVFRPTFADLISEAASCMDSEILIVEGSQPEAGQVLEDDERAERVWQAPKFMAVVCGHVTVQHFGFFHAGYLVISNLLNS